VACTSFLRKPTGSLVERDLTRAPLNVSPSQGPAEQRGYWADERVVAVGGGGGGVRGEGGGLVLRRKWSMVQGGGAARFG